MRLKYTVLGNAIELEARRNGDNIQVTVQGRTLEARIVSGRHDDLILESRGQRFRARGVRERNQRMLWVNGRTFSAEMQTAARRPGPAEEASGLAAMIPGIVREIHVRAGQSVQRGDPLVTLESMKMVMSVDAPRAGRVAEVLCRPGQAVEAGIPLVTLEHPRPAA
ncbi:MAG: biotin/lipoyl-binding protein [Planctomycetes bacterium]|nr:biotin/lipoyl-binding protein [Planctomycetota bacterium]